MAETFEEIEQRLYREGGAAWREYRKRCEQFITDRVVRLGENRKQARVAWSTYYMGALYGTND